MAEPEPQSEENTPLARRLHDGDEAALEEILRIYGPGIDRVLCGKYVQGFGCLKKEDIEDAISEALHRLWKARETYDDNIRPLQAWFYCLADNVIKDVLRFGWQKARALEYNPGQNWLEENPRYAAAEPAAAEERKESKMLQDLKTVVERLPETQRKILLADAASRDEVASSDALAEVLQIPAANVRVYRKRGMDKVRAEMRRLGYDIP